MSICCCITACRVPALVVHLSSSSCSSDSSFSDLSSSFLSSSPESPSLSPSPDSSSVTRCPRPRHLLPLTRRVATRKIANQLIGIFLRLMIVATCQVLVVCHHHIPVRLHWLPPNMRKAFHLGCATCTVFKARVYEPWRFCCCA